MEISSFPSLAKWHKEEMGQGESREILIRYKKEHAAKVGESSNAFPLAMVQKSLN